MAKNAVPLDLKLISGNKPKRSNDEINRRKKAEKALKVAKNKLKPPVWLGEIGQNEFKYIVSETKTIELLTNLDLHALAVYCNVYEQYVKCSIEIAESGIMMEANKSSETVVAAHPLFVKQHQLVQQMRMLQNDLGLSPSARAKIAIAMSKDEFEKEESMFDV